MGSNQTNSAINHAYMSGCMISSNTKHSSEKGGFSLEQLPTLAVLLKMCVLTF